MKKKPGQLSTVFNFVIHDITISLFFMHLQKSCSYEILSQHRLITTIFISVKEKRALTPKKNPTSAMT